MIERLRQFLATGPGKGVALGAVAVVLALVAFQFKSSFGDSPAAAASRNRVYICSETGKTFSVRLDEGMTVPVYSPYSKKDTGYPPEKCFWTADGRVAKKPTLVLLNKYSGKPGPTFCPDCGRLVVGDNPAPSGGEKPPPTKEEYEQRHLKKVG
jgi:hypothetical protein